MAHDEVSDEVKRSVVSAVVLIVVATLRVALKRVIPHSYIPRQPRQITDDARRVFLHRLLHGDSHITHCQLRLNQVAFERLVEVLKAKGLRCTQNVEVEEQVAMFLYVLGHNVRLRVVSFNFMRSLSTVHRHFTNVLEAVMKMYKDVVKQPGPNASPDQIQNPRSWQHFFKDAIGAIDGTFIPAFVKLEDQPKYRTRKGRIAQNVLGAVGFDMKFTYVLAGWEGSARDAKVLASAVRDMPTKLVVPTGKYYLVDAGYGHYPGFIAPYRGARYHRSEF